MTIEFKYRIAQQIKIKELKIIGIVLALFVADTGIQYSVRYFWNGEAKTVYFFDFELEE